MPEDDPDMVRRMVEYLYTGKYEAKGTDKPTSGAPNEILTSIRIHAIMFALGESISSLGFRHMQSKGTKAG